MSTKADTPGHRLYLIRLALGDGVRHPMSLRAFSDFLLEKAGAEYSHSTISLMERGAQPIQIEDCQVFAAVDPKRRGPWRIAFGVLVKPLPPTKA